MFEHEISISINVIDLQMYLNCLFMCCTFSLYQQASTPTIILLKTYRKIELVVKMPDSKTKI